jgi:Lrp/AsnC family leucine-responsive transcriptional regulator
MQGSGRISMKDLGQTVGLTAPAVSERVKKMEDSGIISGYKAVIDFSKLGKTVSAFIDISMPSESYQKFLKFAKESDLIVECHHVTGGDSLIIKVLVDNISELELMIDEIKHFAKTNTSIILSSPIADKVIEFD